MSDSFQIAFNEYAAAMGRAQAAADMLVRNEQKHPNDGALRATITRELESAERHLATMGSVAPEFRQSDPDAVTCLRALQGAREEFARKRV